MDSNLYSQGTNVYTIDHNFLGIRGAIASYLIPHTGGVILIESGPGSTISALTAGIEIYGYKINDVTDVLLTHIHLDHAGAAGWLAQQGAHIYVHHIGAPHLLDPRKLLASAERIYGDKMDELWGEFLSVPEDKLCILQDGDIVDVNGLRFQALDTPGHANHHYAYLFEDICFSGDIGAIRMHGLRHIRLPMPPPEFNLELWKESLGKLQTEFNKGKFRRIAPTHFGIFNDPEWHLNAISEALNEIGEWMETVMPGEPSFDELNQGFLTWTRERSLAEGLEQETLDIYEAANPSWMSSYGIQRYWRKFRNRD